MVVMVDPDDDWRCARCGQEFNARYPGTSAAGRGPMHSHCIAAELEVVVEALEETVETLESIARDGNQLAHQEAARARAILVTFAEDDE